MDGGFLDEAIVEDLVNVVDEVARVWCRPGWQFDKGLTRDVEQAVATALLIWKKDWATAVMCVVRAYF
jgi:hypothetical protein